MVDSILGSLGLASKNSGVCEIQWCKQPTGVEHASINPATGEVLAHVRFGSVDDYDRVATVASETFLRWRNWPAPRRGEIVRKIGEELRRHKPALGHLVTLETGKIRSEGEGEVQEMIDMCDFAVGLSRQLHGLTMPSERPSHRMFEQWLPLGPIGIITAFNFPVAVWAWNAALAAVCGDTIIWKPSPETPLTAFAVQHLVNRICTAEGCLGVFNLCLGEAGDVGERMIADGRLPLISATGSCRMGRRVAAVVGARLGRSLLELGGNNAAIVTESADLDLTLRAVLFASVGTAGQRCTTLRRLILHESIADAFLDRLIKAYKSVRIGDPLVEGILMGPLISSQAVSAMMAAIETAKEQGGLVLTGGQKLDRPGFFVEPTLIRVRPDTPIVADETFAPLLYAMTYQDLDEAILIQNSVEQGLSSAIFTDRLSDSEQFFSAEGSDCGIANVNLGTSGAEIGGAFGGEKATGGGRESGSDAWKTYMRQQTCTVNGGRELPLAQGVTFEL